MKIETRIEKTDEIKTYDLERPLCTVERNPSFFPPRAKREREREPVRNEEVKMKRNDKI